MSSNPSTVHYCQSESECKRLLRNTTNDLETFWTVIGAVKAMLISSAHVESVRGNRVH